MTLQDVMDMRDRRLLFDLDSEYGTSETEQQKIDSVNWAIRTVATRLVLIDNNITLNLVADQQDYNITSTSPTTTCELSDGSEVRVIRPFYVLINGTYLRAPTGRKGLWTMQELDEFWTAWRTQAAGSPTAAVSYRGREWLRLVPKPSAAVVAAGNNFIVGQYTPRLMDDTELEEHLPIHGEVHEAVAYLAAFRSALPQVSEAEGWQRLRAYNAEWLEVIDAIRHDSLNSQSYHGLFERDFAQESDYISL